METLDEQIELLDQIPYTEQASMLLEMIDEYARSIEEFNTLQKLYKNQNVEQLSAIIDETQLGYTAFNQKLLKERNIRWLPRGCKMNCVKLFFRETKPPIFGPLPTSSPNTWFISF